MNKTITLFFVLVLVAAIIGNVPALADVGTFGIGLKTGVTQLDGDWKKPRINPIGVVNLSYNPIPYLSLGGGFGYSVLKTKDIIGGTIPSVTNASSYKTSVVPIEANITFNLFPLEKFNPFVTIGGGGIWWEATYDGETVQRSDSQENQQGIESYLKAEGGVEFRVKRNLGLYGSASFYYSFTDMLDQVYSGDENDAITSACIGLTYYFYPKTKDDSDSDGIPDMTDLDPYNAEDSDGYLDHDGKPDDQPPISDYSESGDNKIKEKANISPIVIHFPVTKAEENHPINIFANIYGDQDLRIATVLYRTFGTKDWKTLQLQKKEGTKYKATIPGRNVTPAGLEYCVLAVNQKVTGVGRAGWPKQPIQVDVVKNTSMWRILGGSVAAVSWGLATYIMLRKQSTD